MDNISLSRTAFEIFDFKDVLVWPWRLTLKSHLRSKSVIPFESPYMTSYLTSMDTCPSLYLVPFSRYSTSKFSGFDLDLWPPKIIRGHKILYQSKAHIRLPIWLLWTPSLYLVPFSRYSTSTFSGLDLDLWLQKVIWGQKILYLSKAHIWLPV